MNIPEKNKELDNLPEKRLEPEVEEKRNKQNKIINAMNFLNENYKFRYNIRSTNIECRKTLDEKEFKFFDDRASSKLLGMMRIMGFEVSVEDYKLLTHGVLSEDYDPFMEYLGSLPKWTYEKDYLAEYAEQIVLDDESVRPHLINHFKKWFVAYVGGLIDEDVVNHTCMVLCGPQGKFKSTFLNSLVPAHMRLHYLYSGSFNVDNKDHELKLMTSMIINLEEMATLNRNEIEGVKARITQDRVQLRKAYGREETHGWKSASFVGSVNNESFLNDLTGSRRWLVFKIKTINMNKELNIDNCYMQAYTMFKDGFRFYFNDEEIKIIEALNEPFQATTWEEDFFCKYFKKPEENDSVEWLTASEIGDFIVEKHPKLNNNNTVSKNIGKICSKYNIERKMKRIGSKSPRYRWGVAKITDINVEYDENGNVIRYDNDRLI